MVATVKIRDGWSNWIGDFGIGADRLVAKNKDDIISLVERAVQDGKRIRAVGSGHSASSCARPRDRFIDLSEHSGLFPDVEWTKKNPPGVGDGERLVRVRSGTRIKTLSAELAALPRPAGMINLGNFDGQTLAGAISTGTHGSGIALGAVADLVVSVDMVTVTRSSDGSPHVQLRRFEPTNGITDRDEFNAAKHRHGMVLEQDDDTFRSVVVSYGCMGVAFAYTLRVRGEYWLREDTALMDWPQLRAALKDPIVPVVMGAGKNIPKFLTEDRHLQLLINLAEAQGKKAKEEVACNIVRRNITQAEQKPKIWLHDGWPPERRNTFLRGVLKGIADVIRPLRAHQDRDNLGRLLRNRYFEPEAREEPFAGNRTATVSHICLKRDRDTSPPDKAPDPPDEAISLEMAVPAEHAALAIDTIMDAIDDQKWLFPVPMAVRFAAASLHYLAPNYGRATCYAEVVFLKAKTRDGGETFSPEETIERIAKPALSRIGRIIEDDPRLQGRPHMGKHNAMTREKLQKQYASFEKWEAVFRRFNQFGTFENDFTDQLGLTGLR